MGLLAGASRAEDPDYITFPSDIDWVSRTSEHYEILFRRGEERLSARTLVAAEKAYRLLRPIFPDAPEKSWIILADFQDSLNGYSLDFPFPTIVIYASPPAPEGDLENFNDWLDTVVLHECVHNMHLYPANGYWRWARWIFGSAVLPNGLLPSHFHEGLAVFLETQLTDGGRGRSSQFNMYERMAVAEGKWGNEFRPYDLFEGSPLAWPHGASPYFFGNLFYEELWSRKGAKGIHDLTYEYSRILLPYFLNGPLEKVYGVGYPTLWDDIFRKKEKVFTSQIAEIRRHPLADLQYLTQSRYSKWDLTLSPSGRQIAFRRSTPEQGTAIEIRDLPSGKLSQTLEQGGHTDGLCWATVGKSDYLVFAEPFSKDDYELTHLVIYDLERRRSAVLRGPDGDVLHVLNLACAPDLSRLLVYREHAGVGSIEELRWAGEKAFDRVQTLRRWRLPEGDWITGMLETEEPWFLMRHRAQTLLYRWPAASPLGMAAIPGHAHRLHAYPGTRDLAVIASLDGRQEIWRLQPATRQLTKIIPLLGGANSFDARGDTWVVSSYRHEGYDIALTSPLRRPTAIEHALAVPVIASETPIAPDVKISAPKEYSPLATLLPHTWFPSLLVVPNGVQFGAFIPGFDASQRHNYSIFGGYDTRGLPFVTGTYEYRFGTSSAVILNPYYLPSYLIQANAFFTQWGNTIGFMTFPDFSPCRIQVNALFSRVEGSSLGPAKQSVGFGVTLSRELGFKRRPLSFAPSRGTILSFTYNRFWRDLGSDDDYFTTYAGIDQFVEAPWWHDHIFKLSLKGGYTEGTAFYNSFFQGGGELLFTNGPGFFLNRGFLPGQFVARRILTLNVEYRFPIATIERGYNLWPLFLHRIHAALTADTTTYDYGPLYGDTQFIFTDYYFSTGLELKSDWTFFFYLPTLVRIGIYHGFGPLGQDIYGTLGIEAQI
jgi:hypothetical protein